jgi:hypothetical protein
MSLLHAPSALLPALGTCVFRPWQRFFLQIGIIMKNLIIGAIALCTASAGCLAAEGYVAGPLTISTLSVVGEAAGGQAAGNMEVKFTAPFTMPQGVYCDPNYVTTKHINDPDRAMLSLLRDAKQQYRTVSIWVSDAPADVAYTGRCALKLVIIH